MSKAYSIYETKAKLSELLRLVKAGKDIVVTERGEPIAKIVPFDRSPKKLAERIIEFKQKGILIDRAKSSQLSWGDDENAIKLNRAGALTRFLKSRE